ncbi:hypothetical protein SCATT_31100 [Streptantibioticus cattleyicolor NRRL 8057 = DSM 46488]|uniref:Uncharacterized protein n=1 Tax=Streptantibioticus cattleyicolor (strain ATCC 35852 / DSM 46488 / JCM 4925 / NBRC 14057 / NRRL 8057) TaxID=1003195 RepID=G8WWW7_STREN|nr:hypothetical protein SCATT_31100 [Streptantibioticus cattleyicolor NRRL 8057 = DSM 46488]
MRARRAGPSAPVPPPRHVHTRCSNSPSGGTLLHRFAADPPSTGWGGRSCPDPLHKGDGDGRIIAGQRGVELWEKVLHSLWTTTSPTTRAERCPPAAHRVRAVTHSFSTALSTVRQLATPHRRME